MAVNDRDELAEELAQADSSHPEWPLFADAQLAEFQRVKRSCES